MPDNAVNQAPGWGNLRLLNVPEPTDADRVQHMVDAIARLHTLLAPLTLPDFLINEDRQAAACRVFSVLGMAAGAVSPPVRASQPAIAWQRWANYGRKLVREYYQVNYKLLWRKWERELPTLREQLLALQATEFLPAHQHEHLV